MKPHVLCLLLTVLLVGSSACNRQADERQTAREYGGTARPAPTTEEVPYSIVRRLTVPELRDALDSGSALAVDVRDREEYLARSIRGAVHVDDVRGNPRLSELARQKLIVTYCACPTEVSSARVALDLQGEGFTNVATLLGGYDAWYDAQLPTDIDGKGALDKLGVSARPSPTSAPRPRK
jgi:rhodanese-related sulfurtransferase